MKLTTASNYFLLALNPKKGYYYNIGNEFYFGLIGAFIMDLVREKQLSLSQNILSVANNSPIEQRFMQNIVEIVQKRGSTKVSPLISRLGFRNVKYKREFVNFLIDQQKIIRVRKRFLFIPYNLYYNSDREYRQAIIVHLRDILLRNNSPESDDGYLLTLISVTRLVRALSDQKDERKAIRKRLRLIIDNANQYFPNSEELNNIRKAIRQAIMAANAAKSVH